MNTERMQGLIAYLQMLPQSPFGVGFNMEGYVTTLEPGYDEGYDKTGNDCGTVCCIAGHCALWFGGLSEYDLDNKAHGWSEDYLDLNEATADWLFVDGEHVGEGTTLDTAIKAVEFVSAELTPAKALRNYWMKYADDDFQYYLNAKENTDV